MKTFLFAALFAGLMTGCANNTQETMTTTDSSSTANPTDRTYTKKDLNNTGRTQTGDAVNSLEPASR